MGQKRNSCGVLSTKTERKRPLGRPQVYIGDNIETDLKEVVLEGVD
jgi:hypothetical protein